MANASSTHNLASLVSGELRKFPGLDPRAVLAIASHEGLGGGIGDNGTSYGPFQLHKGGAYPSSAPQEMNAAQAWATSPAGIDYALQRINSVAGGLRGEQAVSAISRRFERPADPGAEIADALAHYGGFPASTGSAPPPPAPSPAAAASGPDGLEQLLASTIGETNQSFGLGGSGALASLLANIGRRGPNVPAPHRMGAGAPPPPRGMNGAPPAPHTMAGR